MAIDVRKEFGAGRKSPVVIVRRPARSVEELQAQREQAAAFAKTVHAVRVASFPKPKHYERSRFPGVDGKKTVLTKDHPRACILIGGLTRPLLIVSGCGTTRRSKKLVLEVMALGQRYSLARHGITCDGQTRLPKAAVRLHIELKGLTAEIEVAVEDRAAGTRLKKTPGSWVSRRAARPVEGRWSRPKAVV